VNLRHATVSVWAQDEANCAKVMAGGFGCSDAASEAPASNKDMQFCAGNLKHVDTCSGDSGSPVLGKVGSESVQVGLVSYGGGPETTKGNECGDPAWPGIYASVAGLRDFVCGPQGIPSLAQCGTAVPMYSQEHPRGNNIASAPVVEEATSPFARFYPSLRWLGAFSVSVGVLLGCFWAFWGSSSVFAKKSPSAIGGNPNSEAYNTFSGRA
jgi:secreted trypsin-like serine protease